MWNILLVDDDEVNRKLLREVLGAVAVCSEAENGEQAIAGFYESFRNRKPFDAILLDFAMPEMDGMETLKRIREIEETKGIRFGRGIPIIMVTAHGHPFSKAFREGADFYIMKPIDPDMLLEKLQKIIEQGRAAGKK